MLKRFCVALGAALATAAAAFGVVTLTAGSASAAHSIQASPSNPVYWGCTNPTTNSLVGSRFYTYAGDTAAAPLNRYPGCASWARLAHWSSAGATGAAGAAGADAIVSVQSAAGLDPAGVALTNVGGPIKTGVTPLTGVLHLAAGTYQINAYGDFSRKAGTGADNPAGNSTFGTLAVWEDRNSDGIYDWADGENGGTVQTGALPITPTGSIEQSATLTEIITLSAATDVRLGGFGYNSDTGSYGTAGQPGAGDFSVLGAHLTAEKLNVSTPVTN
jgi:hypothetical protein